jgi:hypothetical protein
VERTEGIKMNITPTEIFSAVKSEMEEMSVDTAKYPVKMRMFEKI